MKTLFKVLPLMTIFAFLISACQKEKIAPVEDLVPQEVIDQLYHLGFNPDGIIKVDRGYLIEGDIVITEEYLAQQKHPRQVPGIEQYHTDNLVTTNGSRNIKVYIKTSGLFGSFSQFYVDAVDEAISRYNDEGLELTFTRVSNQSIADISITRLSFLQSLLGVLGSAGFPDANGDPYDEILLNGNLENSFTVNGMATVIAHEMGHCIGLRHTDYFDRSISCGGDPTDEGASDIGANHIPGTPTGATKADGSYMLSCTDGSDRPFNGDDQTALDYLY
jgi:hypothetical protein